MSRVNQRKVGDRVRHKREGWIGMIVKVMENNEKNFRTTYGMQIHGKPESYFVAQSDSVEGVQR